VGFLKNRQLEQDEAWYSAPLGYAVCPECVADAALRDFVAANVDSTECSFCERSSESQIAADTDTVLTYMSDCLKREWSRAIDEYLHDAESSTGYAGTCYGIEEVLEGEALIFANEDAERFVYEAFGETQWAPRDFAAVNPGEALRFGWADLVQTVKHDQRFFFLLNEEQRDEGPGVPIRHGRAMLEQLGELIQRYGLVRELGKGALIYRCRPHKAQERPQTAEELGAPPPEKASQSRMSPAGIAMLYAADEASTALAETIAYRRADQTSATVATFELRTACRIADLTQLPPVPSIFDPAEETTELRHELGFLHGFRRDVSGPVDHDGREHIDYVPTQVVAEYLRVAFRDEDGESIKGVAWESSKLPGTRNVVLFADARACVDAGGRADDFVEPLVELVGIELQELD